MNAFIEYLKDKLGNVILPVTSTKCVLNDDGKNVDDILDEQNTSLSELEYSDYGACNILDMENTVEDITIDTTTMKFYDVYGCVGYYCKVKPNTDYTIQKDGGNRCIIAFGNNVPKKDVIFNKRLNVPDSTKQVKGNSGDNTYLYVLDSRQKEDKSNNVWVIEGTEYLPYVPYIPSVKMLAEETANINSNLVEQGLINKFDNNWTRAYRKASDGTLVADANRLTTTNPIDVIGGDTISIHVSEKMADIAVRFFNGDTYNTNYYYVENATEGVFTVPSGATKAYFNLYKDGNDFPIKNAPTTKIYVNNTVDKSATKINNNLLCLNVLGYEVPEEVLPWYIKQNGRQVTVYGGRVDLSDLNFYYTATGKGSFRATLDNAKSYGTSEIAKIYCDKYKNVGSANQVYAGSKDIGIGTETVWVYEPLYTLKDDFINANKGVYLYYELATPITYTIDGNEAISKINDSLADYDLDNKFDGNVVQGGIGTDGGFSAYGTRVTTGYYSCSANGIIKAKYSADKRAFVAWYNGTIFIKRQDFETGLHELIAKVPSNANAFRITVENSVGITPDDFGRIAIYINNAIDEIKADLGGLRHYNVEIGGTKDTDYTVDIPSDLGRRTVLVAVSSTYNSVTNYFGILFVSPDISRRTLQQIHATNCTVTVNENTLTIRNTYESSNGMNVSITVL